MKAYVKAWQDIYNQNGLITDEFSMKALDSIFYGPVREVDELTTDTADELIAEFEMLHPDFRYDHLEILTDQEIEK